MIECKSCGMVCKHPTEYHPMAACLMFKACHDGEVVRANLSAVAEEAVRLERERVEVLHRMKYHPNIDGAGDWELFPLETSECSECFEVLIVRARSQAPT